MSKKKQLRALRNELEEMKLAKEVADFKNATATAEPAATATTATATATAAPAAYRYFAQLTPAERAAMSLDEQRAHVRADCARDGTPLPSFQQR